MNFEQRKQTLVVKEILSDLRQQVSQITGNVINGEYNSNLRQIYTIVSTSMPNSAERIGVVLDYLTPDAIMVLFKACALVAVSDINYEHESDGSCHIDVLDAIANAPNNPTSPRYHFGNCFNEPALKDLCSFVGFIVTSGYSKIVSYEKSPCEQTLVGTMLNLIRLLLLVLRKAVVNFTNNRKLFLLLCDHFLQPTLQLFSLECVVSKPNMPCETMGVLFDQVKVILHDILYIGLFTENMCNEIVSISFDQSLWCPEPNHSKKRKIGDVSEKNNMNGITSFANRIYEIVGVYTNDVLNKSDLSIKAIGTAISSLWTCFATSSETTHRVGENPISDPSLMSKEEKKATSRKGLGRNLHFALGLINYITIKFSGIRQSRSICGVNYISALILLAFRSSMRNESISNQGSMDKYVVALKKMWHDARKSVNFLNEMEIHESAKCFALSSLFHILRLIQLIDHRVAFDFSKQALQLAFRDDCPINRIAATENGTFNEVLRQSIPSNDGIFFNYDENSAHMNYIYYSSSKLLLVNDVWKLFSHLRCLDNLLESVFSLEWNEEGYQVTDDISYLLSDSSLSKSLLDSFVRLPSGQWTRIWQIVLDGRVLLMTSCCGDIELSSETKLQLPILSGFHAHVLASLFEAQLVNVSHFPAIPSDTSEEICALTAHTKGILCLLIHVVRSLGIVMHMSVTSLLLLSNKNIITAHLKIFFSLIRYILKFYSNEYQKLATTAMICDLLPVSESYMLTCGKAHEYSCMGILSTNCVTVLISLENFVLEISNDANDSSLYNMLGMIWETKLVLVQLFINIDAKTSSLQSKEVLRVLMKSFTNTCKLLTGRRQPEGIRFLRSILNNYYPFFGLINFDNDGYVNAVQRFLVGVFEYLLINTADAISLLDPSVMLDDDEGSLVSTSIIDVPLFSNSIIQAVKNSLPYYQQVSALMSPLYNILIHSNIQDAELWLQVVNVCSNLADRVSGDGSLDVLSVEDRMKSVGRLLKLWKTSLQFLAMTSTQNVPPVKPSLLYFISNDDATKVMYDDFIKLSVLSHHLRLMNCLKNWRNQNFDQSLDLFFQEWIAIEFPVRGSHVAKLNFLTITSISLKDAVRVLTSSPHFSFIETIVEPYVLQLLKDQTLESFSLAALWFKFCKSLKSWKKISKTLCEAMILVYHSTFDMQNVNQVDQKLMFLASSLLFDAVGEIVIYYSISHNEFDRDCNVHGNILHGITQLVAKYAALSCFDIGLDGDPICIHIARGISGMIIGMTESDDNYWAIGIHRQQFVGDLYQCLRGTFHSFNLIAHQQKEWLTCALKITTHLIVTLTTADHLSRFENVYGDILSLFTALVYDMLEFHDKSLLNHDAAISLEEVSCCLATIDSIVCQTSVKPLSNNDESSTDHSIFGAKVVQIWMKSLCPLLLTICEKLNIIIILAKCCNSTPMSLMQCCNNILMVQNSFVSFASRGWVANFTSKLHIFTSTTSSLISSLSLLQLSFAEVSIQQFVLKGLQMVSRTLTNFANFHEVEKHVCFVVASVVQTVADIATSKPQDKFSRDNFDDSSAIALNWQKGCKEALYPGLYALFEKLSLKQKNQIFKLLDGTSRAIMTDIHNEFMRTYKFQGN